MSNIYNPVVSGRSLTEGLNALQEKNFMTCFEELVDDAEIAVNHDNQLQALQLWQKHFDYRFI